MTSDSNPAPDLKPDPNRERARVDPFPGGVIVRILLREILYDFDENDDVGPLRDLIGLWVERPDVNWMIIDLTRVELIESPFYQTLYQTQKAMHARGASFRLCGLTPHVAYVLGLTNLTEFFSVDRDVRAALDAIEGGGSLAVEAPSRTGSEKKRGSRS